MVNPPSSMAGPVTPSTDGIGPTLLVQEQVVEHLLARGQVTCLARGVISRQIGRHGLPKCQVVGRPLPAPLVELDLPRAATPKGLEIVPFPLRNHVLVQKIQPFSGGFKPLGIPILAVEFQEKQHHGPRFGLDRS